jgi:hypothetical protein
MGTHSRVGESFLAFVVGCTSNWCYWSALRERNRLVFAFTVTKHVRKRADSEQLEWAAMVLGLMRRDVR